MSKEIEQYCNLRPLVVKISTCLFHVDYWQPFYIGSIFWPTMYASLNIVEEEIFLENDDDLQLNAAMKSYC